MNQQADGRKNSVLVTGANRGLGIEFVRQFSAKGWRVHACARDVSSAPALPGVVWHRLDVTDFPAVDTLAAELSGEPIDILLNNAGVGPREGAALGEIDYALWRRVLEINSIAPIKIIEAFADHVAASGRKIIASVSSELGAGEFIDRAGLARSGSWIHYRSSKAALNIAQRSIDPALAVRGIISLLLHPGWVSTDLGSARATMKPEDSVAAMIALLERADASMHGKFIAHDGRIVPW